jgi:uncharacterized membrane protein YeiB
MQPALKEERYKILDVVSRIWLKHFEFGPLEWLWRTLTYGKRFQLMARPGAAT